MYVDIQKYTRRLNIKKYMLNKPPVLERNVTENTGTIVHTQLRNTSVFNPQVSNNEHIQVFNRMATQDIERLKIKRMQNPQEIKKGIKELEEN